MLPLNSLLPPLFLFLLSTTISGTPTPENTQSGISATCNKWYTAPAGDTCYNAEALANITHDQFLAWNPVLSAGCAKMFWAGYEYCIGVEDSSSSLTLSKTAPSMSMTTTTQGLYSTSPDPNSSTSRGSSSCSDGIKSANPTPNLPLTILPIINYPTSTSTPSSISASNSTSNSAFSANTPICSAYHVAIVGESCATVEKQFYISHALFMKINPDVSEDCERGFRAGEEFCVGVEGGVGDENGGASSTGGGASSGGVGSSGGGVFIVPVATERRMVTTSVKGR